MCYLSSLTIKQLRSKKAGGVGSLLKTRLRSSTMMPLPCSMYQVPASAHNQEKRLSLSKAGVTQGVSEVIVELFLGVAIALRLSKKMSKKHFRDTK